MNRYPLWKNLLVVIVCLVGALYALPNIYPPDAAIQIATTDSRKVVTTVAMDQAIATLESANIGYFGEELTDRHIMIRLQDDSRQLDAKALIQRELGDGYIVALNKAPTTPGWLVAMGASPMSLGLDLSGGVHFLLAVDMDAYLTNQMEDYSADIKRTLREEGIRFRGISKAPGFGLTVEFRDAENRDLGDTFFGEQYPEFLRETMGDGVSVRVRFSETKQGELEDYAINQNLTTLKNRVNELGVAEPQVLRQGRDRIVVELPGVQDTAQAKKILGKSANLEFRLEAQAGDPTSEIYQFRDGAGGSQSSASLERSVIISGDNVTNARVSYDQQGIPEVSVSLDSKGGARMGQTTKLGVGRRMAVLFIEQKTETDYRMVNGAQKIIYSTVEEKGIISLATIRGIFSSSFVIQGLDSPAEASELALLLRAGALAAPMKIINERTIGASLGEDNIVKGVWSIAIGFIAVVFFMLVAYRVFGVFAVVALTTNIVLVVALLSMLGATLTLPGIAGIVLTVGMAVDANVLIFSRIREEMDNGMSPHSAINAGYDRAFTTILDANLTTLIVAVILYAVGTGPIKGFAVTLSFGIVTSMFTAIILTRALSNWLLGGRDLKTVPIREIWK